MSIQAYNKVYVFALPEASKEALRQRARALVENTARQEYSGELTFAKDQNGKPFFKELPEFYFNISHCQGALAVAFGKAAVGVDIEHLRPVNPHAGRRFFTPEERAFSQNQKGFFYVWTRKEALVKRSGEGIFGKSVLSDVLNRKDIKTLETDLFTVSVCSQEAENFEFVVN